MSGDDGATVGFRVGAIEGRLTAVDERLRAVDRIETTLGTVVEDVRDIKTTMDDHHKADTERRDKRTKEAATEKRQGRRDLLAVGSAIVVAIIGAVVALIQSGQHP